MLSISLIITLLNINQLVGTSYCSNQDIDQITVYISDPLWPTICNIDLDSSCDTSAIISRSEIRKEFGCSTNDDGVDQKIKTFTVDCPTKAKQSKLREKLVESGFICISR